MHYPVPLPIVFCQTLLWIPPPCLLWLFLHWNSRLIPVPGRLSVNGVQLQQCNSCEKRLRTECSLHDQVLFKSFPSCHSCFSYFRHFVCPVKGLILPHFNTQSPLWVFLEEYGNLEKTPIFSQPPEISGRRIWKIQHPRVCVLVCVLVGTVEVRWTFRKIKPPNFSIVQKVIETKNKIWVHLLGGVTTEARMETWPTEVDSACYSA